MAVELALGSRRRGWLPREVMPKLLAALSRCADVRLDNVPMYNLGHTRGAAWLRG